ncbi:MAG: diguanylate cyclase [Woeseiaceae bacterium]|nr:diguanylate cyclase [Woeseiaceae bacterium]
MTLCDRFGFDAQKISERLSLTGLGANACDVLGVSLQERVIRPNVDVIVEELTDSLGADPHFMETVEKHSQPERLKGMLKTYLLSLGRDCRNADYFEDRLHIGVVHNHVDVSLSQYQCAYRLLQSILIRMIPADIRYDPEAFEALIQFVLKITALDMSLAIETFHGDKLADVEVSLSKDSLTGVFSRRHAIRELQQRLEKARLAHHTLCAIMADLDHFKIINDKHGHLSGDEALRIAARRLAAGARQNDIVGRYGGEEFLILLDNTKLDDAVGLAERMRHNVGDDPIHLDDHRLSVTISMGVAEANEDDDAESLIERADRMLYRAKLEGRNQVCA